MPFHFPNEELFVAVRWWLIIECQEPIYDFIMSVSGWHHGCLCHEAELLQGKQCECFGKGRRSAEFSDYKYEER